MTVGEAARQQRPEAADGEERSPKRARFDRCFSGLEFTMEARPLQELDADRLKAEIKRWAKAVVRYARQIGGSFGSADLPASVQPAEQRPENLMELPSWANWVSIQGKQHTSENPNHPPALQGSKHN